MCNFNIKSIFLQWDSTAARLHKCLAWSSWLYSPKWFCKNVTKLHIMLIWDGEMDMLFYYIILSKKARIGEGRDQKKSLYKIIHSSYESITMDRTPAHRISCLHIRDSWKRHRYSASSSFYIPYSVQNRSIESRSHGLYFVSNQLNWGLVFRDSIVGYQLIPKPCRGGC